MSLLTLLDIAKANCSDPTVGLIDETTKAHPELILGAARTIMGINYKTLVRTALPSVDFRNANEGTAQTKSTYENRLVETYTMNPRWGVDKAVADRSEDGPEAELAKEASAHVEAAMQKIASQFYYGTGTGGSTKGFPGLLNAYDSTNMVVDAGGSTATTGSSVWAVKFGAKEVIWVWGANGQLEPTDVELRDMEDADGDKFTGYHQELIAYPGLQIGTTRAIGRIKKLTEDAGKGLTDDLLTDLLSKFPVGVVPDVFFMSRRSRKQLQNNRVATTPTGAHAPIPTESNGIPIAVTDAILDTESLTL